MAQIPPYLSVASQRRVGDAVVVDFRLDTSALERAFRQIAEQAQRAALSWSRTLARWGRAYSQRREVYVAGLEGRYYVRGGLDSRYREPEARDALVRALLACEELTPCHLSRKERGRVAAAFLTGWVQGQGEAVQECLCWPTPPEMWTTHYGAVEPGSAMEWNPGCPVHGT